MRDEVLASGMVKGEEGERRDCDEEGVRGAGVEEKVGKLRGRGEVAALAELEMESLRLSCSQELRFEMELSRLVEVLVEPSRLRADNDGFSPLSHNSAGTEPE